MKKYLLLLSLVMVLLFAPVLAAEDERGSVYHSLERVEKILYGSVQEGGLLPRLSKAERDLFGRELPGSLTERQQALLNYLERPSQNQPSMLFKLGVSEWIVTHLVSVGASPASFPVLVLCSTDYYTCIIGSHSCSCIQNNLGTRRKFRDFTRLNADTSAYTQSGKYLVRVCCRTDNNIRNLRINSSAEGEDVGGGSESHSPNGSIAAQDLKQYTRVGCHKGRCPDKG